MDNVEKLTSGFYILIMIIVIAILIVLPNLPRKEINSISSLQSQISTLESRIAKSDSLVNEFRYDLQLLQEDVEELK